MLQWYWKSLRETDLICYDLILLVHYFMLYRQWEFYVFSGCLLPICYLVFVILMYNRKKFVYIFPCILYKMMITQQSFTFYINKFSKTKVMWFSFFFIHKSMYLINHMNYLRIFLLRCEISQFQCSCTGYKIVSF